MWMLNLSYAFLIIQKKLQAYRHKSQIRVILHSLGIFRLKSADVDDSAYAYLLSVFMRTCHKQRQCW